MSDPHVTRVSLIDAHHPVCIFSARPPGHVASAPPASGSPSDPKPDRYAQGFADGQRAANSAMQAERERLSALVATLAAFQPEPSEELASMIAVTVEQLVTQLVGMVPVQRDWLDARIGRAIACIADADAARTLWLNPDDAALMQSLDLPIAVQVDPTLELGALRIDCSQGWVEDNRSVHLQTLRAALGLDGA